MNDTQHIMVVNKTNPFSSKSKPKAIANNPIKLNSIDIKFRESNNKLKSFISNIKGRRFCI